MLHWHFYIVLHCFHWLLDFRRERCKLCFSFFETKLTELLKMRHRLLLNILPFWVAFCKRELEKYIDERNH